MFTASKTLVRGTREPSSSPGWEGLESLEARQLLTVDLVGAFVTSDPHTLVPGESFTAAMVVNNSGTTAAPAFSVQLRLSTDSVFGNGDDVILGTGMRAGLEPGSSTTIANAFEIPAGTPPGTYFLAFRVDPDNLVAESNENNNTAFSISQLITVNEPIGEDVNLDVFGNGVPIQDGAHIPTAANHTFFGDVDIGDTFDRMFTMMNSGSGTLEILGVTITGVDAADFVVVGNPLGSIGPGESRVLTIRFVPSFEGNAVAAVNIQTNDTDDGTGDPSVFTFAILGAGHVDDGGGDLFPEIEVRGGGHVIEAGDLSARPADGTAFGALRVQNAALTRTFTIFNLGDGTLIISNIDLGGRNRADFMIIGAPSSIAPGESATFQVRFDPSSLGKKIANVRIFSNDADEATYIFRVAGRGAVNGGLGDAGPEIEVRGNNQLINDGDTSPSTADHTVFPPANLNGQIRVRIFTIANTGAETLFISSATLFGRNASDFTIVRFPTSVAPGETGNLRVRFDPSGLGARIANVRILSNDVDEGEYTFRLRGRGRPNPPMSAPSGEIMITGLLEIQDGDTTPRPADGTHFGPASLGTRVTRTYTISNVGTSDLFLTGPFVQILGRNPSQFVITAMPDAVVAPGQSTTFTIEFAPDRRGQKLATVQIHSSASNEAVFDFTIKGRGRLA